MSQIRHLPIAPTSTQSRVGGDRIDRHRHSDDQLIYVSAGVLAIHTEHGSWIASNDRAVWVPAGTWHEHRFYGDSKFHTIGFPRGRRPLLDTPHPAVLAVDGLLRELLIALTDVAADSAETRRLRAVLGDRVRRAPVQPIALPTPQDPRLAEACRLVESDLARPRDLRWLARRVHASERTLSRLFRNEFAMTYPQWRTRLRVFTSMVLLAEGASVTETAHACGFATASAFVSTFARSMGTTPGRFSARESVPRVGR